jgi:hypothetical protein
MERSRGRPSDEAIDRAAIRLATTTRFPTFHGGVYAFTDAGLGRGAWFPRGSDNPLLSLAYLTVEIPAAGSDSFALTQVRCRAGIEEALKAHERRPGRVPER